MSSLLLLPPPASLLVSSCSLWGCLRWLLLLIASIHVLFAADSSNYASPRTPGRSVRGRLSMWGISKTRRSAVSLLRALLFRGNEEAFDRLERRLVAEDTVHHHGHSHGTNSAHNGNGATGNGSRPRWVRAAHEPGHELRRLLVDELKGSPVLLLAKRCTQTTCAVAGTHLLFFLRQLARLDPLVVVVNPCFLDFVLNAVTLLRDLFHAPVDQTTTENKAASEQEDKEKEQGKQGHGRDNSLSVPGTPPTGARTLHNRSFSQSPSSPKAQRSSPSLTPRSGVSRSNSHAALSPGLASPPLHTRTASAVLAVSTVLHKDLYRFLMMSTPLSLLCLWHFLCLSSRSSPH